MEQLLQVLSVQPEEVEEEALVLYDNYSNVRENVDDDEQGLELYGELQVRYDDNEVCYDYGDHC